MRRMMLRNTGGAIPPQILNLFSGAGVACSLRLINNLYSGGLIRVRANDGTTNQGQADVLPHKIGSKYWVNLQSKLINLDVTATNRGLSTSSTLADLVSAGNLNYNGFATTIYDQTLNGNHFIQNTAAKQGKIVNNGVLNQENGKPIILSLNGDTGYVSNFNPNGVNKSVFFVGKNAGVNSIILGTDIGADDFVLVAQNNSTSSNITKNLISLSYILNGLAKTFANRNEVFDETITQSLINVNAEFDFNQNDLALGYRIVSSVFAMYSFQEMIFFNNQSDNLGKQNNINAAFSIY